MFSRTALRIAKSAMMRAPTAAGSIPRVAPKAIGFTIQRGFATEEPFIGVSDATARIIDVLKNFEQVDASKVSATSNFKTDLDLDSLDGVEVVMAIEEEFCIEIPDSEADKIGSVADAVAYITAHPMAK